MSPAGETPRTGLPKRRLGQNFLADVGVAARIAAALDIAPGELVIEIGPGRGALCGHILSGRPGWYLALEYDLDLIPSLAAAFPGMSLAAADALRLDWTRAGGAKIIGNLPYNVASPLIWDIAAAGVFVRAVFMVQREVALRLSSPPGSKIYGGLGAFVQAHARVDYLFTVKPGVFRPRPKVDSAVIALTPRPDRPVGEESRALGGLIKLCFQHRRKQMQKILRSSHGAGSEKCLESMGLEPHVRPEEISPEGFRELLKNLALAISPLTFV